MNRSGPSIHMEEGKERAGCEHSGAHGQIINSSHSSARQRKNLDSPQNLFVSSPCLEEYASCEQTQKRMPLWHIKAATSPNHLLRVSAKFDV